jgi:hypothetical protein
MWRSVVEIRPAQLRDADALAPHLRQADLAEIAAGSGRDPLDVLRIGIAHSTCCWTAWQGSEVYAVFGVGPLSLVGGIGAPWLLGSDLIDRHPRVLITEARPYIAQMRALFPTLRNHVENRKSIRWLKRAGFQIFAPAPFGRGVFHLFEMR